MKIIVEDGKVTLACENSEEKIIFGITDCLETLYVADDFGWYVKTRENDCQQSITFSWLVGKIKCSKDELDVLINFRIGE